MPERPGADANRPATRGNDVRATTGTRADAHVASLAGQSEAAWLAAGRALVLRDDLPAATAVFGAAIDAYPASIDLRLGYAGILWQGGDAAHAEPLLRKLLADRPDQAAAAFLLAKILKAQARMQAAESVIVTLCENANPDIDTLILAVELLDDCGRKRAAADLCETRIKAGCTDPRLHAYAGTLDMQVGRFALARERFVYAIDNDSRAPEWQLANGLASLQHYADAQHPDIAQFERCRMRSDLSPRARASVLFALGKACDDVGDPQRAASMFREGNALVAGLMPWSRKAWRRSVAARLSSKLLTPVATSDSECVPIFIVGMPRSGSTLLAERLSRHPQVCDRGELAWLPFIAQKLSMATKPDPEALRQAATTYITQLRQDDSDARWFIDKQPMNFLHVNLIRTLFPQARIINSRRSPRATALSIWMQFFAGAEYGFAYDFADIAAVMRGCEQLMARAGVDASDALHDVHYEQLVIDPQIQIAAVAKWIGLPDCILAAAPDPQGAISTSSLWQVRQPVHTRSIERWHAYTTHVPELMRFAE